MLTELLKSIERVKILESLLKKDHFTVTEITNETGVSKGLVSRYLNYMKDQALLKRIKQTYYLQNNPINRSLRIILNLQMLKWDNIRPEWVESAGLYGSWASGTNTEFSDVDIWVKVSKYPSEDELNHLYKHIKKQTTSEVNLLVLTPEKLKKIKEDDNPFYHSLQFRSLLLEGEDL